MSEISRELSKPQNERKWIQKLTSEYLSLIPVAQRDLSSIEKVEQQLESLQVIHDLLDVISYDFHL